MGKSETESLAVIRRGVRVSGRNTARIGDVFPRASSAHMADSVFRTSRIGLDVGFVIAKKIMTPFPNVATHIVDFEFVGLFETDRMG